MYSSQGIMIKKNVGGRPPMYDHPKTRTTLSLTIEGLAGLDKVADEFGFSRSELVELVGRGELIVFKKDEVERLGEQPGLSLSRSA